VSALFVLGSLLELIARYGYLVVALFIFAEGVGLPLPGEGALVVAAAAAAQGRLRLAGVLVAAVLGAVTGGTAGYWLGRGAGLALLERGPVWMRVRPDRLERARRFFERYGPATVFLARFVAFFRTYVSILAGASGMPFDRFSVWNGLAGVVWAVGVGGISFLVGENLPRLQKGMGRAGLAVALFLALLVALVLAWRWFQGHAARAAARAWRRWDERAARHPRTRALLTGRLAPGLYLGTYLAGGLALSIATLWLFAAVTRGGVEAARLTKFDAAIAHWFRSGATPTGDAIWAAVSALGSPLVIVALTIGVALWLGARRRWTELGTWCAALAGGCVLSLGLKLWIGLLLLPGPTGLPMIGFRLPGIHAVVSLVAYGLLAHLLGLWRGRPGLRFVAPAAVLVLAIGFSRIYLGDHYFSDVVAGYAAGSVWLAACVSGLEIARRREPSRAGEGGGAAP
jgi:membrane protein DedA with SNARE-associated domain/membrane-associated phospholipid phosphatase